MRTLFAARHTGKRKERCVCSPLHEYMHVVLFSASTGRVEIIRFFFFRRNVEMKRVVGKIARLLYASLRQFFVNGVLYRVKTKSCRSAARA